MIYHPFQTLITFEPINLLVLKGWQVATISYIILLFVVGVTNSLINGWQDKIRTRAYLNFFSLIGTCLLVLLYFSHNIS